MGGFWTPPLFVCPINLYAPICSYSPQGCTPPYVSHAPLGISVFSEASACCGGCKGPLTCWTLPLHLPCIGVPPLQFAPHSILASVYWYVLGILVCHMGILPLCWGFGGVPPSVGSSGGSSTGVPMCSFLYIFVVHYVSHFYHGYDYYSSSYGGIFWLVISFISDCGSFPDGVSSKLGSVCSGSTTTLDAKRLWRCYWALPLCTAATSILDASSGLCQLCYGFSTGRFLFQS